MKECTTHHYACDCREAKFAELESENILSALTLKAETKRIQELERENAALWADKERLDWLGKESSAKFYEGACVWRINGDQRTEGDTLRDAIDAARKEAV